MTRPPGHRLDSLGGAAVNVVAVLLVAWLIGSFVAYSPFPEISGQVNDSAVLKAVDKVIPHDALSLPGFPPLRSLLTSGPYTQVFSALGAESALAVPAPDPAVLKSPGLAEDRDSIVKIVGMAPSCERRIEGSGFVISPDHVLTNAHVVAGRHPGPDGLHRATARRSPPRVVLYDPQRDIAVLDVPGLAAPPLQFAGPAALRRQRHRGRLPAGPAVHRGRGAARRRRVGHRPEHLPDLAGQAARSTRSGRSSGRATRAARCWPRTARSTAWCSRRPSRSRTPATR